MEKIEMYKALDGKVFEHMQACASHDMDHVLPAKLKRMVDVHTTADEATRDMIVKFIIEKRTELYCLFDAVEKALAKAYDA